MNRSALPQNGFTLVEMMVACAVLSLLLAIVFLAVSETGKTWRNSSDKIEAFQAARAAFETITRKLSIATLNTYYDYFDDDGDAAASPNFDGKPAKYGRQSELHFISGKSLLPTSSPQLTHAVFFQAPFGDSGASYDVLDSLLNACGYFVVYNDDTSASSLSGRPSFITTAMAPARWRFRLMELSQTSEALAIYGSGGATGNGWFTTPLSASPPLARVLAENVIALVVLPKASAAEEQAIPASQRIGASFEYDSRTVWNGGDQPPKMNQICPIVEIVLIAIDESSAARLQQGTTTTPPDLGFSYSSVFQTAANLDSDLDTVKTALASRRINYRVFRTDVAIRGSKWSDAK